jgi:hypothetical protein
MYLGVSDHLETCLGSMLNSTHRMSGSQYTRTKVSNPRYRYPSNMSQISHVTKDAQGSEYLELYIPVIDRYGAVENT